MFLLVVRCLCSVYDIDDVTESNGEEQCEEYYRDPLKYLCDDWGEEGVRGEKGRWKYIR